MRWASPIMMHLSEKKQLQGIVDIKWLYLDLHGWYLTSYKTPSQGEWKKRGCYLAIAR